MITPQHEVQIVSLGEAMIEFNQRRPDAPEYLHGFGGDITNAIIAAARQGARAAYVTRVGADAFGDQLVALWRREQVDVSGVVRDAEAPTGSYFVTHTAGRPRIRLRRAGSAASRMTPALLPQRLIRGARFLHVSGISQAISESACETVQAAITLARDAGARVACDSNLRLRLWPLARAQAVIAATIPLCDLFLPSLEDAQLLTGFDDPDAIMDWCLDAGAPTVVLKLGRLGALLGTAAGRSLVPGQVVEAVDATGAGDCFAGALLARLVAGDELPAAVRYANAAAALTTTGFGAVAPIPQAAQVLALLARSAAAPRAEPGLDADSRVK